MASKQIVKRCFACNQVGHVRRHCPQPPQPSRAHALSSAASSPAVASASEAVALPAGQRRVPLVDIGINLADKRFKSDVARVVARAGAVGVTHLILTGTSVGSIRGAKALVAQHDRRHGRVRLAYTAGVHPHDAKHFDDAAAQLIRECLTRDARCVAVGECGLDFNRNFSPRDAQLAAFERQLALAAELKKPLFLHERDAHDAFLELLTRYADRLAAPAIVHCFSGSLEQVQAYLALDNVYIGFTGFVCDEREGRGAHLPEVVRAVPAERLLIETDGPYILPRTLPRSAQRSARGRCEPMHLPYVLKRVAECRGIEPDSDDFDAFARIVHQNSVRVFGLDADDEAPAAD